MEAEPNAPAGTQDGLAAAVTNAVGDMGGVVQAAVGAMGAASSIPAELVAAMHALEARVTSLEGLATDPKATAPADALAGLESRLGQLESAGRDIADAIGLGRLVDPMLARLDALEAQGARLEAAHPLLHQVAAIVARAFPQELVHGNA